MSVQVLEDSNSENSPTYSSLEFAGGVPPNGHAKAINVLYMIDQLSVLGGGERAMLRMVREHSARFRCSVVTFREHIHPQAAQLLPVPVKVIPLVRTYSPKGFLAALALRRLIRTQRIDIVHTFFETSDLFGGLVAKLSGVRVLISSRRDMGILRSGKHKIAYRLVGRLCSRILTVSDAVRNQVLASDRLSPNQVMTLYGGVRMSPRLPQHVLLGIRKEIGVPLGAPIILVVANILPWKGHQDFLHTAALVHRRNPEAHFVVAGAPNDPELFSSLLSSRTALGLDHCFHFLGEAESVGALYQLASVFCLMSRTEGLPNVVLEAMAGGLPVVATNAGGTGELVVHGKTGFLVEVGAVENAADRICSLLSSPQLIMQFSESARSRIERNFTVENMISSLEGIYESSLAAE